jgi:hypothetical protein
MKRARDRSGSARKTTVTERSHSAQQNQLLASLPAEVQLQHLLLRYTQALLTQMAQTASAIGTTPSIGCCHTRTETISAPRYVRWRTEFGDPDVVYSSAHPL